MTNKSILLIIAVFALFYTAANAQESLPRNDRRPVLIDDINRDLLINLNKDNAYTVPGIPVDNITASQNEQLRAVRTEKQKQLNRLDNQLAEKRAQQRTLETQDKPSMKAINKLIDEQAELLINKMKIEAEYKQKIRSILTEEQRVEFDSKVR